MVVGSIGFNYVHDTKQEDFFMNCPKGPGAPVLLIVKAPAIFTIKGVEYRVKPNSFVFLRHDTPCTYTADGRYYVDDWFFLDWDAFSYDYFAELSIPFDTPTYIGSAEPISQIIHTLCYEHYESDSCHKALEAGYIDILFHTLSRIIQRGKPQGTGKNDRKNFRMEQLRAHIYSLPAAIGTVDDMAIGMGMSRSTFQHTYKKMFGVSVMDDVISGRVKLAKDLLSATNLNIKEIATQCGYTNEYSFMRQFKSRTGKTPTEYRQSL